MADNVAITAGTGTSIATEDEAGVHYQKVKLVTGESGATTPVQVDVGPKANALRVAPASDITDGTYVGDIKFGESLPAGTANIGDVDVLTLPALAAGTAEIGKVAGTVAHDASTANNPVTTAGRAVAHGANPTAVAAGDVTDTYFNRHGVQFVIGGHPNIVTASVRLTGSNTDAAIIAGTIAAGTKVVVTRLTVTISNATTVNVGIKIGFGASTLAADSTSGAAGILIDSDGFPPGGGVNIGDGSGIIGIGADGEELRITNDAPTSGAIHVTVSYFTIES